MAKNGKGSSPQRQKKTKGRITKERYSVSLTPQYVEACRPIFAMGGFTLSSWVDMQLKKAAELLKNNDLLEKPFKQWTVEDLEKYYSSWVQAIDEEEEAIGLKK